MHKIPFNKPYMTGIEIDYIKQAHTEGHLSGGGKFTELCKDWLTRHLGTVAALMTHSCTASLEMAAMLIDVGPGDEVIMPSFTFVSTANAFALRGATPIFVDIDPKTLNINPTCIEAAITKKTKAIVPVHYAGVACDMERILKIAESHNLPVIEDAAQALLSTYKGRKLGTLGAMGTLSFHETKNIISGEGGALLVNNPNLIERAEVIIEKGTNRKKFFKGEVDKYTWVDIGSSYLPSEIVMAFLYAQLEQSKNIIRERLDIWNTYHRHLESLENSGTLRRPQVPDYCEHNGHIYYIILDSGATRTRLIRHLSNHGFHSVFHYIPLHSSPAGQRYGKSVGNMSHTDTISQRLLRLPLWVGLPNPIRVTETINDFFRKQ
jgi:dTDP-4-amino-4,6-dideoxygalactose transaminase